MHFVSDSQRRAVFSRLNSRGNYCDVKSHVFSRLSGLGNLFDAASLRKVISVADDSEHSSDNFYRFGKGNSFSNGVMFAQSDRKPSLNEMLRVISSQAGDELKKKAESSIHEQAKYVNKDEERIGKTPKENFASIYMMLNDISHDSSRPVELRKKCSDEVSRMTGLLEKSFLPDGEFIVDVKHDKDDDVKINKYDDDDDDDILDPYADVRQVTRRYTYMTESDDDNKRGVFSGCVA